MSSPKTGWNTPHILRWCNGFPPPRTKGYSLSWIPSRISKPDHERVEKFGNRNHLKSCQWNENNVMKDHIFAPPTQLFVSGIHQHPEYSWYFRRHCLIAPALPHLLALLLSVGVLVEMNHTSNKLTAGITNKYHCSNHLRPVSTKNGLELLPPALTSDPTDPSVLDLHHQWNKWCFCPSCPISPVSIWSLSTGSPQESNPSQGFTLLKGYFFNQ